jgi:hypothetical protein
MQTSLNAVAALVGTLVAVACSQTASPISPSPVASVELSSHATSPITSATGSFSPAGAPVLIDARVANGNTIVTQLATFNLTGDLVGVYSGEQRSVITSSGDVLQQAFRTFVGTLNGVAGTLEFREVSTGTVTGTFQGQVTVLNGTGDLAGVHCQGTFDGDSVAGTGTYSLSCH